MNRTIKFNENIKLILADVDETIADVYKKTDSEMILELEKLLEENRVLFLISGGGLLSIRERITDLINPALRHRIIVAHCSGAEVWGFQFNGDLHRKPYFGIYEGHFTEEQKKKWRQVIQSVVSRFNLHTYPTQPKKEFVKISSGDPFSVMLADRGPQITFEFVNSVNLRVSEVRSIEKQMNLKIPLTHGSYDLRFPVMDYMNKLYEKLNLPISAKLAGTCALDSTINGADKTKAIMFILEHENVLLKLGINKKDIDEASEIEIWGDKFGQKKGGPDFQMCLAVSPKVRAIDFRKEDKEEIPRGYNIILWNGRKFLHDGLLEYLKSRKITY